MSRKPLLFAICALLTAVPVSASQPDPDRAAGAPSAPAGARYCLKVEASTGSRIEHVRCETREGWAMLEVDLDKEWAREGIRVIA